MSRNKIVNLGTQHIFIAANFQRRMRLPPRCQRAFGSTTTMHVDLLTLYLLAIGTLLASAGMTYWEHLTHPKRSKELRVLAGAYTTLAIGCAAAVLRRVLSGEAGVAGAAISNLLIVGGYLLILHGVALMHGRQYRVVSLGMLALLALTWAVAGVQGQAVMWAYVSAFPIAVASGLTAREFLRDDGTKLAPSRYIVVVVTAIHALFYIFRACILPWLAVPFGVHFLSIAGKVTMYEGVLYSVVLPMAMLRLVREESHSQLLQDSQTDYLTRLGNRRWFFEEGERIIREHTAKGQADRPTALLVFDLDHFKGINDQFGHKTGDEVLRAFAETVQEVAPSRTVLARIGGEEFAMLLPGYETFRAREVGESVARRFAESVSAQMHALGLAATVSIGLAQFGEDVPTLSDLLAAADRALYSAKSLGRNRLEVAQSLQVLRHSDDELSISRGFS